MPIVGTLVTTTELKEIPLKKGVDKKDVQLVFCNTATVDNYLYLSWHKDDEVVQLYFNYPVAAYDTYPRDNTPFTLTLGVRDKLYARSTTPGIQVTLLK